MLLDLWAYLAALYRHWKGYLTGSVVTALVGWGALYGFHLPRWGILWAFLAGLPVAAFLAWRDERRTKDANLDHLGELQRQGRELCSRQLPDAEAVPEWESQVEAWVNNTATFLAHAYSVAFREWFLTQGIVYDTMITGSKSLEHNRMLLHLSAYLNRLGDIIGAVASAAPSR